MEQTDYQKMYEETLRSGTRKLKLIDFFGGYYKFNDRREELRHELFEISENASRNNTPVLSTKTKMDLEFELLMLEVNRDVRIFASA